METKFNHFTTVRFGWTKAAPPVHTLTLTQGRDFDIKNNLPVATDAFIHKVADMLHRRDGKAGLKDSGAIAIRDLTPLVQANDPERLQKMEKFQHDFAKRSFRTYAEKYPDKLTISPEKRVLVTDNVQDGRKDLHSPDATSDKDGRKWTYKTPHYDSHPDLVAHLYPPTKNVTGGEFFLYDLRQYIADHPGKKLSDIIQIQKTQRRDITLTPEELEPYRLTVKRDQANPFIALFNNTNTNTINGVAHGAEPVAIVDPNRDFYRGFKRVSLTIKRPHLTPPPGVTVEDL